MQKMEVEELTKSNPSTTREVISFCLSWHSFANTTLPWRQEIGPNRSPGSKLECFWLEGCCSYEGLVLNLNYTKLMYESAACVCFNNICVSFCHKRTSGSYLSR